MNTRGYVQECKRRALEQVISGHNALAVAAILSDFGACAETRPLLANKADLLICLFNNDRAGLVRWIRAK